VLAACNRDSYAIYFQVLPLGAQTRAKETHMLLDLTSGKLSSGDIATIGATADNCEQATVGFFCMIAGYQSIITMDKLIDTVKEGAFNGPVTLNELKRYYGSVIEAIVFPTRDVLVKTASEAQDPSYRALARSLSGVRVYVHSKRWQTLSLVQP